MSPGHFPLPHPAGGKRRAGGRTGKSGRCRNRQTGGQVKEDGNKQTGGMESEGKRRQTDRDKHRKT